MGTVLTPPADALVTADTFTGAVAGLGPTPGSAAGWVAVRWDGRGHPVWVDPADLIPATAAAAVV